jgi:hypothetical protein
MADTTTQQMALTRNYDFMERVTAIMAFACNTILTEPADTPYHDGRAYYAKQVVANPQNAAHQAGPQVVMGVNVVNATVYDEITKTSECTIADIDLQSQVLTLWNSLAGLDTPS